MQGGKIVITSFAVIAVIAILLATAFPAWAQDAATTTDYRGWDKDRGSRMGHAMKDAYMTIAVDGMSGSTATFSVMNMAMVGKEDKAVLITPASPLTGTYNTSADMGYISTANFMPATMTVDNASSISVPVAGASAVLGMHDWKVLTKEKGFMVSQFRRLSVALPDGTVKDYKLDKPVRVTYEKDRKMVVIDGYPSYTKLLSDALAGGATFPSGAPAMPLTGLQQQAKSASTESVGYEKPAYVAPPA